MLKKPFKKDPPTTLPKFFESNLTRGREHSEDLFYLKLKYHSTELPEMI